MAKDVEQVELSCIVVLIKLTTPLSSDPASPLLDTVPKRNENIYAQKDLYKNAYNIWIQNSPKLEATKTYIRMWLNKKKIVVYP